MTRICLGCFCLLAFGGLGVYGQRQVAPENLYERVVAVVPLVGTGAAEDPKRPEFLPWPYDPARHAWLRGMTMQLSDDGKSAVVEFVVQDRSRLKALFDARRPDVKVFVRGKDDPAVVEAEVRRVKKDFDRDKFPGRLSRAEVEARAKGAK